MNFPLFSSPSPWVRWSVPSPPGSPAGAAWPGWRSGIAAERRAAGDKVALLERAETTLRDAFASLSAEALRQNNQCFLALAQTKLGEFQQRRRVGPRAAAAGGGRPGAADPGVARAGGRQAPGGGEGADRVATPGLVEQVRAMARTQQALQAETGNLVKALRAPHVRGRWGEIQLRRVVEMAGMLDYCDFVEQARVEAEDGRLRPDLIVRLPGGKTVVVDAKAPLAAYLDASDGSMRGRRPRAPAEGARPPGARPHGRSWAARRTGTSSSRRPTSW